MTGRAGFSEGGRVFREEPSRKIKTTVLIVVEGKETEPNYFHGLKEEDSVRANFHVTVKKGKGGSRVQIVQEAVNRKKEQGDDYDEAWCVMDIETLDHPDSRSDLDRAIKLARDEGLNLCLSNPSFEVWFLAHFRRTSRSFNDADAVIVELDKHWTNAFGMKYDKADSKVYVRLRNRTHDALTNAENVRTKDHRGKGNIVKCNSSTGVYLLVRRLLS